jgi:large subunit ribosomal protein L15
MKLHDLKPDPGARKARKRVGRGNSGAGGTYAGRGRKGQNARSGESRRPYFEGGQLPFVRRLPFKRGFTRLRRVEYAPVNLSDLEKRFDAGAMVTAETLSDVGLLRGANEPYKILGDGDITKAMTVHAPRFSASASQRIQAAGGTVVETEDAYVRAGLGRPHTRYRD